MQNVKLLAIVYREFLKVYDNPWFCDWKEAVMKKKNYKEYEEYEYIEEREERKRPAKTKRKKRKKRKNKIGIVILILLALVALFMLGWYLLAGKMYRKMHVNIVDSPSQEEPMKEEGVINILLIGNDSRDNSDDGRSDAMILLSISNKTKTIHMTSFLRDIYVEIPGYGSNRLNAAYAYGGAELLMETIEANFDVSVNRYMQVNFQAFASLVDAVGGVDLELTNDEVLLVNGYLWEYNILEERPEGTDYFPEDLEGLIHLNGPQALAYCRNRYIGNDFGRTERQRKVLSAVAKQAPKALLNMDDLIDGLFGNITTNLTQSEFTLLTGQASKLLTYDIVQGSIPLESTYENITVSGMAVLGIDFEANNAYIRQEIYGEE